MTAASKRILWAAMIFLMLAGAQAQTFTLLHTFKGNFDGTLPHGALLRDGAGNLYGTTSTGANHNCIQDGCGSVFKLSPGGIETMLHRFVQTDGAIPNANLIRDKSGTLYSTVAFGGSSACSGKGCGAIFSLDTTGKLTLLYVFTGGTDGQSPYAGLIRDPAGNFYGVALAGGTSDPCGLTVGCGTIFKLDTAGKLTVLHIFTGGADGANPYSALVRDSAGNLYGTASRGGTSNKGTVFKLDPSGNLTVLHTFTGTGQDGSIPYAGLIHDAAGNFYGTTMVGGRYNSGTVFKLDPAGNQTVLYAFTGGTDGQAPWASLVMDKNGNLFGTTAFGGVYGDGTVFELDATGKQTVLHSFNTPIDGNAVIAPLILDSAGNLYGTADEGGFYGYGTVFKITP
jgi:uncharacterized repeat protein (TIGR03803 family)